MKGRASSVWHCWKQGGTVTGVYWQRKTEEDIGAMTPFQTFVKQAALFCHML